MRTVAALYVDPLVPYPKLGGVITYDGRFCMNGAQQVFAPGDARLYSGPMPIVAHPPCAPWSRMRHLAKRGAKRDADRSCAPKALEQVRAFGGVLEHPEHSTFWEHAKLPTPLWSSMHGADCFGGRSYLVNQLAWGHRCSKPTWLYVVGVDNDLVTTGIRFGGVATHRVTRGPGQADGLKVAHSAMRSRSPVAFAEWLVSLARMSRV